MIIGIDHGYGYIKTKNRTFLAGVAKLSTQPPILKNIIKYQDEYYQTGIAMEGIMQDKTVNENYYIGTLAAIAEELKIHHITKADISLAFGLPLTRFGAEKDAFSKYLTKNRDIEYSYEDTAYKVRIMDDVYIYPQGYAAVAPKLESIKGSCYLVDIGTATTDILPIYSDHRIDLNKARSLQWGTNECIARINEEISRQMSSELTVNQILDVMSGNDAMLPEKVMNIIREQIELFCNSTLNLLRQNKVNYEMTQTIFMGGGGILLKEYCRTLDDIKSISYITNIKANATGYETLARASKQRN